MESRSVIFVAISIIVVASIYSFSSSIPFQANAAGPISCNRTGTVTITCCQDQVINRTPANPAGTLVTYCTDCEVGPIYGEAVPENCGERYIQMSAEEPATPVPPGAVQRLQEGGVPEESTILPEISVLEGQRANVTILPGGIIQDENTSSNDNSEQSDLASDETENTTRTANDEEQDEGGPSMKQSPEGSDNDKENIDEELPLE